MCACVRVCVTRLREERELGVPDPEKGNELCERKAWDPTRKDMMTFLVGIEPMTWWCAAVAVTTAPHPHTHSP